jgi:hypothetical protein
MTDAGHTGEISVSFRLIRRAVLTNGTQRAGIRLIMGGNPSARCGRDAQAPDAGEHRR